MNKLTKGAIAGAAGIALLLGGAGSFALWNANASLDAGTINAGTLTLSTKADSAVWKDGNTTIDSLDNFRIVPGDTITLNQDLTVTARGNDLSAKLAASTASLTGDSALVAAFGTPTVTQTYTVTTGPATIGTGANADVINFETPADSSAKGDSVVTVHAVVTIAFPFTSTASSAIDGVDNTTQGKTATLSAVQFTLTQQQPNAHS